MSIRVGILGATGYVGEELIEILLGHPQVRITALTASSNLEKEEPIAKLLPRLGGRISLDCFALDVERILPLVDLVFLALPHTVSQDIAVAIVEAGKKVIDLSADFRLKDPALYEKWYHTPHRHPDYLEKAVYGLTELNGAKMKGAELVANPGCYPTGAILALAPMLSAGGGSAFGGDKKLVQPHLIIIDAKSGATGAGKKPSSFLHFPEVHGNLKAYKVNAHQHSPEIEQELSELAMEEVDVVFTPHLLPTDRGILTTCYARLKEGIETSEAVDLYRSFYKKSPFVRIHPAESWPELAHVARTNFCDIGVTVDTERKMAIIISAIDNLVKGAAGQAVQNLNCMYEWDEKLGLLP
ncbi:MAG: N-acetyl-gamma-glutamyl-phosphate reductase [Candidatus Omnitrophica bacterium]|nr:N-acetyl-gamma-glutamyl-phosphate reductase [Candidatus Omnitrophota bacterium]